MSKISFRSMLHQDKQDKQEEETEKKSGKKVSKSGKADKGRGKTSKPKKQKPAKQAQVPEKEEKSERVATEPSNPEELSDSKSEKEISETSHAGETKVMSISELISVQPVPESLAEPSPRTESENNREPTTTASISSIFKIEHSQTNIPPEVSEVSQEFEEPGTVDSDKTGSSEVTELTLDTDEYQSDQIITFLLGTEEYGLNILDAREVKQILPLTPIPRSPDWVLGIVNLRGMVFPVVDLKKRLNIESDKEYPISLRRIIVVEIDETKIGLMVDRIHRIFNKQLLDFSTPPALISGGEDFISAIAKKEELIVSIISVSKLFTTEEKKLLAKIKEEKT